MKREEKTIDNKVREKGFSEQEFIDYLEERLRKLRQEEQKFREEALTKQAIYSKDSQYSKIED